MSTTAQIDANRQNAQHSTGPLSDAGKQRAALNALSHGIYNKALLLPKEDPAELELLRSQLVESHAPANAAEQVHVERIIACQWKLLRLQKVELEALQRTVGRDLLRELDTLSRIEQRLNSMILKAEKALRDLRKEKASQDTDDTIAQNEPNSSRNPSTPNHLPADPDAMMNLLERLEHQITHAAPAFAASAVLKSAPNPAPELVAR